MMKTRETNWPPVDTKYDGVEVTEWNGFTKDDPCRIDGDRDGRYIFLKHITYPNGNESCVLYGGKQGHKLMREVGCDVVLPWSQSKGRGDEAPGPPSQPATSVPPVDSTAGLRARREALNWSRSDVSNVTGLTVPEVATLEKGGTCRKPDALVSFVTALSNAEAEGPMLDLTDDDDEEDE